MLTLKPFSEDQVGRWCSLAGLPRHQSASLSLRIWVFHPSTRIYVRLLGPCFKTGRMRSHFVSIRCTHAVLEQPAQGACRASSVAAMTESTSVTTTRSSCHRQQPAARSSTSSTSAAPADSRSAYDRGALTDFQSLPFQQFQVLFNSLFKVLFIFPSRYLFAIGLSPIFSLR